MTIKNLKTMSINSHTRLPSAALESHLAIVGRTGSGKTFRAKGEVEDLLRHKERVCILDPTGAWWGLKSSSDGKSAGFPVVIFGGSHADIPINEHAGEALGKLVAESDMACIVDLSDMGTNARNRFSERFFESLYQHNRSTLYLVADEADEFAPQAGPPGTERMLGAFDRIVRRGRIKGFRVWMISQRPAVLNKNVLTQANTLIAMRLPSSQDRKAVELWIKGQADESAASDMLSSLASLPRGAGWTWAPEQNMLEFGYSRDITTFDSSRAPAEGHKRRRGPKKFASVDLSRIRQDMASAIAEAEANDPRTLKKQIAQMQHELRTRKQPPAPIQKVNVVDDKLRVEVRELVEKTQTLQKGLLDVQRILHTAITSVGKLTGKAAKIHVPALPSPVRNAPALSAQSTAKADRAVAAPPRRSEVGGTDLSGPEQKLLDALAFWEGSGETSPRRAAVATIAGYSPTSTSFTKAMCALRTKGMVSYPSSECLRLEEGGRSVANPTSFTGGLGEFHYRIYRKLTGPEAAVLRSLVAAYPNAISREEAAEQAGYSITSTSFTKALCALRTLGYVEYPDSSSAVAQSVLFPNL